MKTSTRNKGNNFPQETMELFNKEITKDFPMEIGGSVSNGKFVKHYIKLNSGGCLAGR